MKTPEQTAEWLVDSIAHIYLHPQMYAKTKSELDSQLRTLHRTWAFVVQREVEYRRNERPICDPKSPATRPNDFYDRIRDRSDLDAVVQQWQALDAKLGIELPSMP